MSRIVVAASPLAGHTAPMLTVARDLVERGHDVTLLTGSRFEKSAAATGAHVVTLSGVADFHDDDLNAVFPERSQRVPGPEQLNFDIMHVFSDVIPDQHAALQALLVDDEDRLVFDQLFLGAWPVLLGAPGIRPRRCIGIGISPLALSSDDTTVMGPIPGLEGEAARQAHRAANAGMRGALEPSQAYLTRVLRKVGAKQDVPYLLDGMSTLPDAFAQLTVQEFEFARSDAPASVHFVGALPSDPAPDYERPSWWKELDEGRPVVAVTQGTLANDDLGLLIEPTLEALADEDVLVIVTVGRDAERLDGRVPANARVENFVPYDLLMSYVDVLVTNGGYGTVQKALLADVPMVVGGATEDKPFVAARVAAFGVGLDLGPAPTADAIRDAVHRVLTEPEFKAAALPIRAAIEGSDPLKSIADLVTGG